MPIRVPDGLPATETLRSEGVKVMRESRAEKQDIRPLRIAILNLMPLKIATETQLARLLGTTPLQVDLTLVETSTYRGTNTASEHMDAFYRAWDEVRSERFDGFMVTGAPIETLEFQDVKYWPELQEIFDWTTTNVFSMFAICWGAQAALNHFNGVPKHLITEVPKRFGIFEHQNLVPSHPLMQGIADLFEIPVSRHTENHRADVEPIDGLTVLAENETAGLGLLADDANRRFYMFNHLEYDSQTLREEYDRDVKAGQTIVLPQNYFPNDDPAQTPPNKWRSHAHMLYGNWVNWVYQNTPFNLDDLGGIGRSIPTGGCGQTS